MQNLYHADNPSQATNLSVQLLPSLSSLITELLAKEPNP